MTSRRGTRAARPDARREWNPLALAALTGLWLAVLPNWPLWRALAQLPETGSLRGGLFVAGFGLMIAALMTAILALAAWRWTIKPAANFLVIAAAIGAHFMGSYGAVIDTTMMTSTLQTNLHEVGDLLNARVAIDLLVLGVLPIFVITRLQLTGPRASRQLAWNAAALVAALLLLGGLTGLLFADLSTTMRNHKSIRYLINPLNSLYALVDLGIGAQRETGGPLAQIGLDARPAPRPAGARPPLVLLVVGETARADHFSLNGYPRPTNRELAGLGVVSFTAVTSCGTNTAASLPCMFSARGKEAFEKRRGEEENLLDLVQRAGYAVLWVDNQAGCKNLCSRVPNAFAIDAPAGESATRAGAARPTGRVDEAPQAVAATAPAASTPALGSLAVVGSTPATGSRGVAASPSGTGSLGVVSSAAVAKSPSVVGPAALRAAAQPSHPLAPPVTPQVAGSTRAALCADGECLDEALLLDLDARIDALPAAARARGVLVVLHQMGSHGPAYFKRSPPDRKPFQPECKTSVLQQCTRQALVDAYDNSIAYTDHMLASAVQWLASRQNRYDAALAYVSDHGESLGDNGIYLHGLPYSVAPKEQTHVPMVVWLSPQTERRTGITSTCLAERRNVPLSHDNLFHSVVGLLGIEAGEYKPALDAFAPCRQR